MKQVDKEKIQRHITKDSGKGHPKEDVPSEVRLPNGTIDRPITKVKK